MSGGKFAFQNRLGQPYSWMDIYRVCCVLLCTSPREVYIWRGDLTEGFLCYEFGGLILILEGLIFGILWCTIVSHVLRPVLCWSAKGGTSV